MSHIKQTGVLQCDWCDEDFEAKDGSVTDNVATCPECVDALQFARQFTGDDPTCHGCKSTPLDEESGSGAKELHGKRCCEACQEEIVKAAEPAKDGTREADSSESEND